MNQYTPDEAKKLTAEIIEKRTGRRRVRSVSGRSGAMMATLFFALMIGLAGIYWPIPTKEDFMPKGYAASESADASFFADLDKPTPLIPQTQINPSSADREGETKVTVHISDAMLGRHRAAYVAVIEKKPQRAIKLYRSILRDTPYDPTAMYNLAITLHQNGDNTQAIAAYKDLLQHHPNMGHLLPHHILVGLLNAHNSSPRA